MEYDIQKLLVIKEKPKNTNVSFDFVGYESHFRFLIVMIEKFHHGGRRQGTHLNTSQVCFNEVIS